MKLDEWKREEKIKEEKEGREKASISCLL